MCPLLVWLAKAERNVLVVLTKPRLVFSIHWNVVSSTLPNHRSTFIVTMSSLVVSIVRIRRPVEHSTSKFCWRAEVRKCLVTLISKTSLFVFVGSLKRRVVSREESKSMSDFLSSKEVRIHAASNWVRSTRERERVRIVNSFVFLGQEDDLWCWQSERSRYLSRSRPKRRSRTRRWRWWR